MQNYIYTEKKEITPQNIYSWIQDFTNTILKNYVVLKSFYDGKDIINKIETELDKFNGRKVNIIHSNLAKMIVTNACGYFMGKPVTYSFADSAFENTARQIFYDCDEQAENQTLAKNASKYGVAYELMALDEKKQIYIKALSPMNTFFVVDNTIKENKICAITFWTRVLDNQIAKTLGYAYTKDEIISFELTPAQKTLGAPVVNPFKPIIPVFEYKNNDEMTGDYEHVTELLGAYSKLMSTSFDDVDSVANSILAILNATLQKEEGKNLKRSRVLQLNGDNADAKYINKVLDSQYVSNLRKALRDDIFSITNVPDLTDEKFAGNQSGVALSYKLIGFENLRLIKKNYFEKGLFERLTCLYNYKNLTETPKKIAEGAIEITFYTNLPSNIDKDKQVAELYNQGVLSLETTLKLLESVEDADEETRKIQNEKPSMDDLNG